MLVATDESGQYVFTNSDQNLHSTNIEKLTDLPNKYYRLKFNKVSVEGVEGNTYTLQLCNDAKKNFEIWGNQGYVNFQPEGMNVIFALGLGADGVYGQDGEKLGLWTVDYVAGSGYVIKNVGRADSYLSPASSSPVASVAYIRLFTELAATTVTLSDFDFSETTANTTTFDLDKATNYDKEVGKFTANGGWTFDEPQDLSKHKWLIVVTAYNAAKAGGAFTITDSDGKSMGGDAYQCEGKRGSMWLDRWNNQICAAVNMEYVANSGGISINSIKSLTFSNNQPVSAVYLTNYEDGNAVKCNWGWGNCEGDVVRKYSELPNGTYGTIALNYDAAVSSAYIYSVAGWSETEGITLTRHYGIMKAGVPYFYCANEENGLDGNGGNYNVSFFRVDANQVSGDWTDDNTGNGLVGVYKDFPYSSALPGCYILNDNKMQLIDTEDVQVKATNCFFDPKKYKGQTGTATETLPIASQTTGLNAQVLKALNSDKIYDLNGREVKKMQKGGVYIMGGMKVCVK